MQKKSIASVIVVGALAGLALAQTAPPASQSAPTGAEQRMNEMLRPPPGSGKPLQPSNEAPGIDKNSGKGSNAAAPNTPGLTLQREGTYIFDRAGHMTRSADGSQVEFAFISDAKTLKDPPVVLLPNLQLMNMENAVRGANRDQTFRVTGMLTEYRQRNYLLLEKVVVVNEGNAQF